MATYTVWADIVWLVNFVLDGVLLWAAGRFGGFICRRLRLSVAAALGALYGVGLLYPALAVLYIMPLPLLFPLLMLWVAFGRMPLRRFGWLVLCFYLLAAVMGGVALAVRPGLAAMKFGMGAVWLLPALLAAVAMALMSCRWLRRMIRQSGLQVAAVLDFAGRSCTVRCFQDSGNTLREPVSGRPVLICELGALRHLLPWDLYAMLDKGLVQQAAGQEFRPYQLLQAMQGRDFARALTLVPYRGVEGAGLLGLGIMPDGVSYILPDGRRIAAEICPVLLPVATRLCGIGGCRGLINPMAVLADDVVGCAACNSGSGDVERRMVI